MSPFTCPKCGMQFERPESGCPGCGWLWSIEITTAPPEPGSGESGVIRSQATSECAKEVQPRRRPRKWPWIVLGLLVLVFVLRETGILSLDFYQYNSTAQTESSYQGV